MSLGKSVRLKRLQNASSGRIFTVAVDHAPSYGVLEGLEDFPTVLENVAAGEPDALLLMQGTAEQCFAPYAGRIALILKSSTLSPLHPERDILVSRVEDAVRLGADAIAMAATIGSDDQPRILQDLSRLVREAERAGMPVIVHAYPNGAGVPPNERYSAQWVGYASRLAMEVGVDVVKTFYTGSAESFARVVEMAAPARVVAAGGPRLDTTSDVLHMVHGVVQAGAAGITFGRNVWQSDDPAALMGALKHILHNGGSVEEAAARLQT